MPKSERPGPVGPCRTSLPPPAHLAARRRTTESSFRPPSHLAGRPGAGGGGATTSPVAGRQSSPTLTGVPSSWTGLGALLSGAGERAPADALTLAAVASGTGQSKAGHQVNLSGISALPAGMAPARSTTVLRALDSKGRLQLPVDAAADTKLPAERDGALVTVYLPGTTERPRPNYVTNALHWTLAAGSD